MTTPTYPPRKVNDVANSIFNSSDYAVVGNDLKYVKLSGSTMTGALSCVGLTSSSGTNTLGGTVSLTGAISLKSNITLPTAYNASPNNAVPSISQLGGTNKQSVTTPAAYTASSITNLKTISLNQGIYLLIYRVVLTNTSAAASTVSAFSISVSTAANALDDDFRVSNYATQTIAATTGQTSLSGCGYYSLVTGTSVTLYLNYFATASAATTVGGFIQAVRIG
jgi:hypothetical protein